MPRLFMLVRMPQNRKGKFIVQVRRFEIKCYILY